MKEFDVEVTGFITVLIIGLIIGVSADWSSPEDRTFPSG